MTERIKEYLEYISGKLDADDKDTDWNKLRDEHLIRIEFYMHERLVHLIVMCLVALLMMMSVVTAIAAQYIYLMAVAGGLLILLVPYIMHYYFLENSVQKLYDIYDNILEKMGED